MKATVNLTGSCEVDSGLEGSAGGAGSGSEGWRVGEIKGWVRAMAACGPRLGGFACWAEAPGPE